MMSMPGFHRFRLADRQSVLLWALVLFLSFCALSAKAAASCDATLDRSQIAVGDTATLSLTVSGGNVTAEPNVPSVSGLTVQGTGTQSEVSINNFQIVRTSIYTFELSATAPGNYTIPPIPIGVDGQTVYTKPLRLVVAQGRPTAAPGSGPAFVQINVPTTNVYFGQVIRGEIKCYAQAPDRMQQPVLNSDGFSASQIINPDIHLAPRVVVNGAAYFLYVFQVALTANKTGPLTVGPATWELNIAVGPPNIFGERRAQHISVNSASVPMMVQPVPAVPPNVAGFSGAVGNFNLAEFDASPTTLNAGDPITLKIRIAGAGGFDNVALSTNEPGWGDFKTYPPTSKFDSSDPLQIEGSKYFEQVVTPLNASVKQIPPFEFTFFDPDKKTFRTLTHAPIAIEVKPTAATPVPTVVSANAPPPEEQQSHDIVHIKPFLGHEVTNTKPLILQPWFLALQAVPPLLWIAALLWRRRQDNLANNPRLRRQRQVARVIQEGLADLSKLAAAGEHEKFYAGVFRLLQEQLGERLDLPATAITEAALESLPPDALDAATFKQLQELFQACNQYRYTPEHTSQEMTLLIPKLKTALAALQQMKPRQGVDAGAAAKSTATAAALGGLLLLLLASSLRADAPDAAFSQANKLYEEGKYADAAAAYESLLQKGEVSDAVLFNLGDARFKSGHLGLAIAAYRQAENLFPRDPDIRANLRLARDQVVNFTAALPGNRWDRWALRLTLDQWAIAASVALAAFFLTLAARQLRPNLKKSGPAWPIALAAVAVVLLACLWLAADQRLVQKSAVVIVNEAVARHIPLDDAQSAFTLRDGSEVLVVNQNQSWAEVADAAGQSAWVPQKDLAFIP